MALRCFIIAAPLYAIGEIWGVFKVGSRYNNGLVQAGSIVLLFIPIIGQIVLLVGMNEIIKNLK